MEVIFVLVIGTALISWYRFFMEPLQQAKFEGVENEFTARPFLAGAVFLCLAVVASPLLFLPTIIPSMGKAVRSGMASVICADSDFQS